jgi:anti-sigma factor RsiW
MSRATRSEGSDPTWLQLEPGASLCPDENQLLMAVKGALKTQEREAIELHIDACETCRQTLAQVLKASVPPEEGPEEPEWPTSLLPRGTNVGRFVLLDCLGRGGMAVVYAAYDPELDRKVAIKLLRTDLPAAGSPTEPGAQLLSEAQAMARLSHPNVIVVYDVGTFQDQVFLAMEFVRGSDLRGWLGERVRSWREILEIFLRAGEGLAAAHRSGLVHRDFKPDNVLVGQDGQLRVTDFGLARALRPPKPEGDPSPSSAAAPMVQYHSALSGTPLYIAPEQWRGARADERSDQFSFCVALFEALYRQAPYPGRTSVSFTGALPEPTEGTSVPGWTRRVLQRGLSVAPERRYPSMQHLLDALSTGLRRGRYGARIAVGVFVLLGIGLSAYQVVRVSAARKVEMDLARAVDLFRANAEEQEKLFEANAQASLSKEYLLEALGKAYDRDAILGLGPEPEDGLELAHEVIKSADLPKLKSEDALIIVDAVGRLVYNHADESSYGQTLQRLELIDSALSSQPIELLWSPAQVRAFGIPLADQSDDDLLLVLSRPISRGRNVLGAVLVGRWVKNGFLPNLEQVVGDRVVLRAPDGARAATLEGAGDATAGVDGARASLVKIGSVRYLAQSAQFTGLRRQEIGRAFLLRNFDAEVEPILSRFRRDAIKLSAVMVGLALLAYGLWSLWVSRRLG